MEIRRYPSKIQIGKYTSENYKSEKVKVGNTSMEYTSGKTKRKTNLGNRIRRNKSEKTDRGIRIRIGKYKLGNASRESTNRKISWKSTNRCNLRHCNIATPHPGGGVLGAYTYRPPKVGG